jgi:hypothetical protein
MARYPAQQLALPCSLDEAVTFREAIARLEQTTVWRYMQIQMLQEQLDALQADCAIQDTELRKIKFDLIIAQSPTLALMLRLQRAQESAPSRALPSWLSQALRQLLPLAYPNKWRQGQATTVLAHALIMALSALRTQVQEEVVG